MSRSVIRIEVRAKGVLRIDEKRNSQRLSTINAAAERISKLLPGVEGQATTSVIQDLLFERALQLFEEGRRAGNHFSPLFEQSRLLAALLGALEYKGTIRDVPIIDDPESLEQLLMLVDRYMNPRLLSGVVQLLLNHYLTLQGPSYAVARKGCSALLDQVASNGYTTSHGMGILTELGSALLHKSRLERYVQNHPSPDPLKYLEAIGFSSRDLHGQFTQAFALAWIAGSSSDTRPNTEMIRRLSGYSGDAEYKTVLWAHTVMAYEKQPDAWDTVFPKILVELPDFSNTALWRIKQVYLSSYQIVLDSARALLQRWLNREMSRSFFDYLRFNQDRKKFWEQYVEKAQSVRIAASTEVIDRMLSRSVNPRYLRGQYIPCLGAVPVLIIEGNTRLFIEFGEENHATYVYQRDTGEEMINRVRYQSILHLKQTALPITSNYDDYRRNRNVRLRHHPTWVNDYRKILELSGEFK